MNSAGYLNGLNPEQREAVQHFEGPLLVLAGAGSGKTRVLTTRIARLVLEHGVDAASILAVTFTNKAAGEMRERIIRLLGRDPAGMWMGTFHAIGARLLRRHAPALGPNRTGDGAGGQAEGWSNRFSIYDADQSLREIKRVLEQLQLSPKRWNPKAVRSAISSAKNQLVSPEEFAEQALDVFSEVVAKVFPLYDEALQRQNAFDFDDLLIRPVQLFRENPSILDSYQRRFHFLLVDEYQDTNRAQYRLLELLARTHRNLMVVGDDDQSIYGWRGADIRNILDFEKEFQPAAVVRLERNYRSSANILTAANAVIEQNSRRLGKTLYTEIDGGERLTRVEALDERDEAEWVTSEVQTRVAQDPQLSVRDFVILYRTNAQSRALEEALRRRDLPYQIVGGTRFYERREIMDVLAYLRLVSNPRDAGAFDRIVNVPRRGIGDASRSRLLAWAAERDVSPIEAAAQAEECPGVGPTPAASLNRFAKQIRSFQSLAQELGAGELLDRVIHEIALLDALRAEGPEGEDRIENVGELVAGAHEFDTLRAMEPADEEADDATPLDFFLQKVALVTDVDRHDAAADMVTLMTLHNAKGLEFPYVFITGLEDGLFPLAQAYDEPDKLEEERRLFYVGITRAERKLYLTHAQSRRRGRETLPCKASNFLDPLPAQLTEERRTLRLERAAGLPGMRSRAGGFGSGWAASTSRDQDGGVVDYLDSHELPRFVKGEHVRHPQFGLGRIRELSGFGRDLKAVIEFERIGRKKIMVRYANLQKTR